MEGHEFYCTQDEDGRCQKCFETTKQGISKFLVVFGEVQERIDKELADCEDVCDQCLKEGMDYFLAKIFRSMFLAYPRQVRLSVGQMLISHTKRAKGLEAMPLAEKALEDLLAFDDPGDDEGDVLDGGEKTSPERDTHACRASKGKTAYYDGGSGGKAVITKWNGTWSCGADDAGVNEIAFCPFCGIKLV